MGVWRGVSGKLFVTCRPAKRLVYEVSGFLVPVMIPNGPGGSEHE